MVSVTIEEAASRLPELLEELERTGDEVIIRGFMTPVAKLVPFRPVVEPRRLGGWEGLVTIADDFDDLPDVVATPFHGLRP